VDSIGASSFLAEAFPLRPWRVTYIVRLRGRHACSITPPPSEQDSDRAIAISTGYI
jgi:hypothetical protein